MRSRPISSSRRRWAVVLGVVLLGSASWADPALAGPCAVPDARHPTIQSAADDFRCSDILVSAGVFVEQVSLNRAGLSLTGAGAGRTIIVSPSRRSRSTVPTSLLPGYTYVVQVRPGGSATLADLTIDGASGGRCGERYFGIRFAGASGTLRRVVVENVRGSGSDFACPEVIAVGVTAEPSQRAALTMDGATVRQFQQVGIVASGTQASLSILNSVVHGAGPQSALPQSGIRVTGGAQGTIDRTTLTDLRFTGDPCLGVGTGIEVSAAGQTTISAAALLSLDRGVLFSKNTSAPVSLAQSRFIETLSGVLASDNGSGLVTIRQNAFISTQRSSAATVATCFDESGDAVALRNEAGSQVSDNSAGDSARCAVELLAGSSNLTVTNNQSVRSGRVDLEDKGSGNRLSKNRCLTSSPAGLCSGPPAG